MARTRSAEIRARLNHPILDADGHTTEFEPMFVDHLRDLAGPSMVERYKNYGDIISRFLGGTAEARNWYQLSDSERRRARLPRPGGWGNPIESTLDRVAATIPGVLYDRMEERGIDYSVIYPSLGLTILSIADDELRQACCRAMNNFHADIYSEYSDRMTPAAVIPMHTPEEAIAELEHAVNDLKLKVVVLSSYERRPVPIIAERYPEAAGYAYWVDTFGLDSEYDYDPVWKKCLELKVSPTFHSPSAGLVDRASISSYMYNQIGMFAAAGQALAKSLFLGGVTRRFPELRCAILEGGVGWGCMLYADLLDRWTKRNFDAMQKLNPARLDREAYADYFRRYGGKLIENGRIDRLWEDRFTQEIPMDPAMIDEFDKCKIEKLEDIRDIFVPQFFFGCEADDPANSWAFDTKRNAFGAKLNAIFGSDIGHWDVPKPALVVEEAYEMVEHDLMAEEDFKSFVFTNAVKLWAGPNPDFFKGTVLENAVAKLSDRERIAA